MKSIIFIDLLEEGALVSTIIQCIVVVVAGEAIQLLGLVSRFELLFSEQRIEEA